MRERPRILVTAPRQLWPDIARAVGGRWEAVAVPMVEAHARDDRNYPRLAQYLAEGRFSMVVFVNLLSARFALQGPSGLVRAAASGLRDAHVLSQAPEVVEELARFGVDSAVPLNCNIYDFLEEQGQRLKGANVLLVSGTPPNPLIAVGMERMGAKVERLFTYTTRALRGAEQREAVAALLEKRFSAVTFESAAAADALFRVPHTVKERRLLSRTLEELNVRAQNPVVAEALAKHKVGAWVPQAYDFAHLFA